MITTFKKDLLTVQIFETRREMGYSAALLAAEKIRNLLDDKESISVIFAAAPSQNEFLAALAIQPGIDWNRITAFHMDEYVGLPADAPQGFGNFLRRSIFDKVPLKEVFYLNGNAANPEEECRRYGDLLNRYLPEMVCMGIGENTHIAFNDPHVADLNDPKTVKVVYLDQQCRQQQVNDGCFEFIEQVPTHALTLTIPTLLRPETVFCVVPGEHKAQAVYHTMIEPVAAKFPSTSLRKHFNAILFLDKDSAKLI